MFGPPRSPAGRKPVFAGQRVLPAFPARAPDKIQIVSVIVQRACLYLAQHGAWRRELACGRCLPLQLTALPSFASTNAAVLEPGLFHRPASAQDDIALVTHWFTDPYAGARLRKSTRPAAALQTGLALRRFCSAYPRARRQSGLPRRHPLRP